MTQMIEHFNPSDIVAAGGHFVRWLVVIKPSSTKEKFTKTNRSNWRCAVLTLSIGPHLV